jgi:hypothetical protein
MRLREVSSGSEGSRHTHLSCISISFVRCLREKSCANGLPGYQKCRLILRGSSLLGYEAGRRRLLLIDKCLPAAKTPGCSPVGLVKDQRKTAKESYTMGVQLAC